MSRTIQIFLKCPSVFNSGICEETIKLRQQCHKKTLSYWHVNETLKKNVVEKLTKSRHSEKILTNGEIQQSQNFGNAVNKCRILRVRR